MNEEATKPRRSGFTCPKCGSWRFGTFKNVGGFNKKYVADDMVGHCNGYRYNEELDRNDYCDFEWRRNDLETENQVFYWPEPDLPKKENTMTEDDCVPETPFIFSDPKAAYIAFSIRGTNCFLILTHPNKDALVEPRFKAVASRYRASKSDLSDQPGAVKIFCQDFLDANGAPLTNSGAVIRAASGLTKEGWTVDNASLTKFVLHNFS